MYKEHFGFAKRPFENTPDPSFLFLSASHREVLASLIYGINSAKGFILISGDVGTGKTTLVQALLKQINPSYLTLNIINPKLVFSDLMTLLAKKLGIQSGTKNPLEILDDIQKRLKEIDMRGQRTILIIDEAHLLSEQALEDIRLLSNIESHDRKLIQIVLVAQSEIHNILQMESVRPLKQRIMINRILTPLNKKDTWSYIAHRLMIAGSDSQIFNKKALYLIWKRSQGIPRLINHICDNALLIGYSLKANTIGPDIIKEVIDDMDAGYPDNAETSKLSIKTAWFGLAILAIFLIIGGYVSIKCLQDKRPSMQICYPISKGNSIKRDAMPIYDSMIGKDTLQGTKTESAHSAPAYTKKWPGQGISRDNPITTDHSQGKIISVWTNDVYLPAGSHFISICPQEGTAALWKGNESAIPELKEQIKYDWPFSEGLYVMVKYKGHPFLFGFGQFPLLWDMVSTMDIDLWQKLSDISDDDFVAMAVSCRKDQKDSSLKDTIELRNIVHKWANAWKNKEIKDLMDFYSNLITTYFLDKAKPVVYSKRELLTIKQNVLKRSGLIELSISDPVCLINPGNHHMATVYFHQSYKSEIYEDEGTKILYFSRVIHEKEGKWKIVARLWVPSN